MLDKIRTHLDPKRSWRPPWWPPEAGAPAGRATSDAEAPPPAARDWLRVELPKLVAEGVVTADQAQRIADRYGLRSEAPSGVEREEAAVAVRAPDAPPASRSTRPSLTPFISEHAISIVLYLGAFLVVAAVLIYLTYNWGEVGGTTKLATMVGVMAGFLAAAAVCLPRPSVAPAGRTFLAIGAILVPANVEAAYAFLFAEGPLPEAAFWLLSSVLAGSLYAALSLRLESRAYGFAATLAAPVSGAALADLVGLAEDWSVPAGQVVLAIVLVLAPLLGDRALASSATVLARRLLPVGVVGSAALPLIVSGNYRPAAVALLAMALGTGREATRPGGSRQAGLVGALLAVLIALPAGGWEYAPSDLVPLEYAVSLAAAGVVAFLVAQRLADEASDAWGLAAGALALGGAWVGWQATPLALGLCLLAAILFGLAARGGRVPAQMYGAVLAVDLGALKLADAVVMPAEADARYGLALGLTAVVWWLAATRVGRGWSVPLQAGAALTGAIASALLFEWPALGATMAAALAVAATVAARRRGNGWPLAGTAGWLMLAAYQAAAWVDLDLGARLALSGLASWPLLGLAVLARPTADEQAPSGATRSSSTGAGRPMTALDGAVGAPGAARFGWAETCGMLATVVAIAAALGTSNTLLDLDSAVASRAVQDARLVWTALSWANAGLALGALAYVARSGGVAVIAALALAPALAATIARLHPSEGQAYALPLGGYLLLVAHLARRSSAGQRRGLVSGIAVAGMVILLGTSLLQALDSDELDRVAWAGAEGLALAGWGIATRWRPLVAGGVAGVVAITVRLIVGAVEALPSWALVGGSGLVLLLGAVGLLLLRDRLRAAGQAVSERWESWD